jgi:hypothetical protein
MTDKLTKSTLRPGLLVGMKTSITGNMKYTSAVTKQEDRDDGSEHREWEGTSTVFDKAEHERAVKVRSEASGLITSVCAYTPFGLLCPEDREDRLAEAIDKARTLVNNFNAKAKFSHVKLYIMAGYVAADNEMAMRAINGEVSDLVSAMEKGIAKLDVKGIRDAAYKARMLGQMLQPKEQEAIKDAIEVARAAASKYAKAGEQAAVEVDKQAMRKLADSRKLFLDMDAPAEVQAPKASGRAVLLDKHEEEEASAKPKVKPAKKSRSVEIDFGMNGVAAPQPKARRGDQLLVDPPKDFEKLVAAGAEVIGAVNEIRDSGNPDTKHAMKKLKTAQAKAEKIVKGSSKAKLRSQEA